MYSDGWVQVGVFGSLNFSFEVSLRGGLEESQRRDSSSVMKDNWNSLPLDVRNIREAYQMVLSL